MTTLRHFFLSSVITQNIKGDSALEGGSVGGAKERGVRMTVHSWLMVLQRCRGWGERKVDVSHLPPDP